MDNASTKPRPESVKPARTQFPPTKTLSKKYLTLPLPILRFEIHFTSLSAVERGQRHELDVLHLLQKLVRL